MVDEPYERASTGKGKLPMFRVRAFTDGGYALEKEPWLRAFFSAGGKFRHAESIGKLIAEVKKGTKHRVQQFAYRPEIASILKSGLLLSG